jgi:hypothetical protein
MQVRHLSDGSGVKVSDSCQTNVLLPSSKYVIPFPVMKTEKKMLKIPWNGGFLEFPKPEFKPTRKAERYRDGHAYTQAMLDDEWERWEKQSLYESNYELLR